MTSEVRYDTTGQGDSQTRQEDPTIRNQIQAAPGNARTIVNVGAGTGSCEPGDRYVTAVEPGDVMAMQRPGGLVPALRADADDLPLRDGAVEAAMALLSLHHWKDCRIGLPELRRRSQAISRPADIRCSGMQPKVAGG